LVDVTDQVRRRAVLLRWFLVFATLVASFSTLAGHTAHSAPAASADCSTHDNQSVCLAPAAASSSLLPLTQPLAAHASVTPPMAVPGCVAPQCPPGRHTCADVQALTCRWLL
jgi:hypothetical protein